MKKLFNLVLCIFALQGQIFGGESCPSALTIAPGVGIDGIVTIGMTINEAKDGLLQGVDISETLNYSYDNLSGTTNLTHRIKYEGLGILAEFNADGLVSMVQINFKPSSHEQTFSGSLPDGLLIGGDVGVSKDAVVKILGKLRIVSGREKLTCMLKNMDCSYLELESTHDIEVLYYHSKGIYCLFTNGTLQRVGVFSPRKERK